ncbi:MAG: hypothetical protein AAGA30_04435 [Planctomycetota bacterium]
MLEIANKEIAELKEQVAAVTEELSNFAESIHEQGGPWLEGEKLFGSNR